MDHAAFIDLHKLDDEAKKELKTFIEFLTFKGKIKKKGIKSPRRKKLTFKTLSLDTSGFKFSREEANER